MNAGTDPCDDSERLSCPGAAAAKRHPTFGGWASSSASRGRPGMAIGAGGLHLVPDSTAHSSASATTPVLVHRQHLAVRASRTDRRSSPTRYRRAGRCESTAETMRPDGTRWARRVSTTSRSAFLPTSSEPTVFCWLTARAPPSGCVLEHVFRLRPHARERVVAANALGQQRDAHHFEQVVGVVVGAVRDRAAGCAQAGIGGMTPRLAAMPAWCEMIVPRLGEQRRCRRRPHSGNGRRTGADRGSRAGRERPAAAGRGASP